MSVDGEIVTDFCVVRYSGLRKIQRDFERAGGDVQDMRELMHELGNLVIGAASPPVGETGGLANTMRAGRGKTKAVVRSGGARAPYAGVIHYGYPARNIAPQPYLLSALAEQRDNLVQGLEQGIESILKRNDLPTSG